MRYAVIVVLSFFIPTIALNVIAGVAGCILALIGIYGAFRVNQLVERRKWRNRIEPVFIVSNHPDTGEETVLPPDIDAWVIHVPYRQILKHKKKVQGLLTESKNPLYSDELPPANRLPIVTIFFRHGEFVNERWSDFDERVEEHVKAVRANWHALLAKTEDWYLMFHHREKD